MRRKIEINKMNKKGAFTDLFLFMIVALILLVVSGLFIYMGGKIYAEVSDALPGNEVGEGVNYTTIIDNSLGTLNTSYRMLYWISVLIMVSMVISIFIGSYMITTRPIFFVPYIFIVIIAIIVSIGISNAYQSIACLDITEPCANTELAETFRGTDGSGGFVGSNYIMYYLPVWITIIGFIGGIIMFVRMRQEEYSPYG